MTERQAYLTIRMPKTLRELLKAHVSHGLHMNESDFVRESIREKLQREAPDLYQSISHMPSKVKPIRAKLTRRA